MLKFLFATLLVALSLTLVGAAVEWQNFDCPDGSFSVLAPGLPEVVKEHNETPLGRVDENTYRWRRSEVEWVVEYSDVPEAALAFNGSVLFSQVRRGFQRTTGQPVKNESAWKFGRYPGRSFEFVFAGRGRAARSGMARTFLAGNRLFVLTVTWNQPQLPASTEEATRFFDSLQLK